jgi:transcriptional regulator with XRE-family HTH domain
MGRAKRARPQRLPAKLLNIREALGLTREVLLDKLYKQMPEDNRPRVHAQNISAYEQGEREPSMLTLLAYARLVRIPLEVLVDDALDLPGRLRVGSKSGGAGSRKSQRKA